ncbi:sporulation protein [Metabacillus litoralis]|uniref:Sporulation protein n=1 Tax=Metabacillus litoralis TaxID=152268 RepID=A0A5C6W8V2_9BACI|nr:sporulation protein [Metabacillus litoralis]TXC92870.1 sporulation protein [Metabacillus litoralis]
MSLFNKIIASVGVGSAKVDTKISKSYYTQGEILEGVIEIIGGVTEQKIQSIQLNLMTLYGYEDSDRLSSAVVSTHIVNNPFTINSGERKEIPFSFRIPLDTPITMRDPETNQNVPPVWIDTDVNIQNAVDPSDKDYLSIEPTEVHEDIVDAIKIIGFKFRQMESQKVPFGINVKRAFVQQYEFVPSFGKYLNKLDELEVYIIQDDEETTIYFEVDKKSKGAFSSIVEKLNLDEHRGSITFKNEEMINNRSFISNKFEQIIEDVLAL